MADSALLDDEESTKAGQLQFLSEMDRVVPWAELVAVIEPFHPQPGAQGGRPPIELERMLHGNETRAWGEQAYPGQAGLIRAKAPRVASTMSIVSLLAVVILGCSDASNHAFLESHDSIRTGMTMREAFEAGLAEYLKSMGTKNVPGATLPDKQPVSGNCPRHVLDILYSGAFRVRVYCGMNSPSAPQLVPEKIFDDKREFLQALDADYLSWSRNMEFRVESPPRELFGIYDHYLFTTDQAGRIDIVSPVISAGSAR